MIFKDLDLIVSFLVPMTQGFFPFFSKGKYFYSTSRLIDPDKAGKSGWAIVYHVAGAGAIPYNMSGFNTVCNAYSGQPYNIFTHATDNDSAWMLEYQYAVQKNVLLSLNYANFRIKDRSLTNLKNSSLDKCYCMQFEFFF